MLVIYADKRISGHQEHTMSSSVNLMGSAGAIFDVIARMALITQNRTQYQQMAQWKEVVKGVY